jgi:hypothetical protein
MSWILARLTRIDFPAAIIAGLAGGVAFYITMLLDLKVGKNVDDRIFLGRPLVKDPEKAKAAGTAMHVVNSAAFGVVYAMVEDRIPGPPWWKGTLFFNIENLVLYPLTAVGKRHPAIADGQIDPYWTWPAFLQSIPRHIAYGAALGIVYDRLRRRSGDDPR